VGDARGLYTSGKDFCKAYILASERPQINKTIRRNTGSIRSVLLHIAPYCSILPRITHICCIYIYIYIFFRSAPYYIYYATPALVAHGPGGGPMESQNGPPPGDAFSTHFISICFLMAPEASRRFLEVFRKVVYIFVQSGSGCPIIKTAPYIYIYIYIYIYT
jgi:hypothetical protein